LAPAMAGTDLFTHIRYMTITTIPTIVITIIIFSLIGIFSDFSGAVDADTILHTIEESYTITPWLFLVPLIIVFLIVKKTSPLIALLFGTLLGAIGALIFQPHIVAEIAGQDKFNWESAYKGIMQSI